MTRALLKMGECVAAIDLSVNNLVSEGDTLASFTCDVTDPGRVEAVVVEILQRWGRVDILVNNACLALYTPFNQRNLDEIRRELEVNFFGYLNLIRAVLPAMKRQGRGVIHNMSSAVGFTGMPGMLGYTSSKGAIEAMTRTLALEYAGQGIVFNVMHPPLTRTQSAAGFGVPPQMMADPEMVGRKLAKLVGKERPVLVAGVINSIQLWMSYHLRVTMGKMMAVMAERARMNSVKAQ